MAKALLSLTVIPVVPRREQIGIATRSTDPELIHEPSVGVVGTKGDSQCSMGRDVKG